MLPKTESHKPTQQSTLKNVQHNNQLIYDGVFYYVGYGSLTMVKSEN